MPRPPALTAAVVAVARASISHREPRATVAARVGVSERTLRRWLARARRGEAPYAGLLSEVGA